MVKSKGRLPFCNLRGQYQPGQLFYELKGDVAQADRINNILYGVGGETKFERLRKL